MSLKEKLEWWLEKKLGGHVSVGPVTVYGFNTMHVEISVETKRWGSVCFHPDLRFLGRLAPWMLGKDWPWYFYLSPNHTPWASTLAIGPGVEHQEKFDAIRRWALWGHNYSTDKFNPQIEKEFFWNYIRDFQQMKKRREEANCTCGACGGELSPAESVSSNVCLKCLLKEMQRVADQIREAEGGGQSVIN